MLCVRCWADCAAGTLLLQATHFSPSLWLTIPHPHNTHTAVSRDAIHRLFLRYRDAGEDGAQEGSGVGVEGIQLMCEELGVAPDDVVVLVLRWVPVGWVCQVCPTQCWCLGVSV